MNKAASLSGSKHRHLHKLNFGLANQVPEVFQIRNDKTDPEPVLNNIPEPHCNPLWQYLLIMSTISKRKQKRSDIETYYRNESKTFWFGPLKIGTEAERFGLVRIFLYQKQFVSVLAHRFWDEANQFELVQKLSEAKWNVLM